MTLAIRLATLLMAAGLSACASAPPSGPSQPPPTAPLPRPSASATSPDSADLRLVPAAFSELPGWLQADLKPALAAFQKQCEVWRRRPANAPLTGGRYGGTVSNWMPACSQAAVLPPGDERRFFETWFQPALVEGPGEVRLTGYFEPVISARRFAEPGFTEPLLRPPADMLTVDIAAFAEAQNSEALRSAPKTLAGRSDGSRVGPYLKRADIRPEPGQIIAFAHPADVYNIQVQGSGRLRFEDGGEARAQFAGQNGHKWNSALGELRRSGRVQNISWATFRAWLDANPQDAKSVLNSDPSYVFFQEETLADPSIGPRGAAGIPLTRLGSLAVDPSFHPYGALIYLDGTHGGDTFQRLLVAQDTGGAIRRGPRRGDVFFGPGADAGAMAVRMNAPARGWTLLPRSGELDNRVASVRDGPGDAKGR